VLQDFYYYCFDDTLAAHWTESFLEDEPSLTLKFMLARKLEIKIGSLLFNPAYI
jgi:hypothetical protein